MKRFALLASLVLAVLSATRQGDAALQIQGATHFQGLGYLPGGSRESWARDASADGSVVVGWSRNASGVNEAFIWTSSTGMVGLGQLPGDTTSSSYSNAYAISADGSVVVGESSHKAFRWTSSTGIGALDTDSGSQSTISLASSVSANGQYAAGYIANPPSTPHQAAAWVPGPTLLGDIPGGQFYSDAYGISNDGRVVGVGWGPAGFEAFTSEDGVTTGLGYLEGGNGNSAATAITPDGQTIVGHSDSPLGLQAYRWTEQEGMVGLGDLSGGYFHSEATGVSADGSVIIGNSDSEHATMGAFVWTAFDGMLDLQTILSDSGYDMSEWSVLNAWGISDDGRTIVGMGHNSRGDEAWIATLDTAAVPAPSSLTCLVGVGVMVFGMEWWKKRRLSRRRTTA